MRFSALVEVEGTVAASLVHSWSILCGCRPLNSSAPSETGCLTACAPSPKCDSGFSVALARWRSQQRDQPTRMGRNWGNTVTRAFSPACAPTQSMLTAAPVGEVIVLMVAIDTVVHGEPTC